MGFSYIRNLGQYFQPKTPATALRGVAEGYLPAEAYVFKATSVKPLFEKPFDLEELERILARRTLDFSTKILLKKILTLLIDDPDPEIALFAAESINLLENRYLKAQGALKKRLEVKPSAPLLAELAVSCYELGVLNQAVTSLYQFYLKEAASYTRALRDLKSDLIGREFELEQSILLALQDFKTAEDQGLKTLFNHPEDPTVVFALCRIAFAAKDFHRLSLWADYLAGLPQPWPVEAQAFLTSWRSEFVPSV